MNSRKL